MHVSTYQKKYHRHFPFSAVCWNTLFLFEGKKWPCEYRYIQFWLISLFHFYHFFLSGNDISYGDQHICKTDVFCLSWNHKYFCLYTVVNIILLLDRPLPADPEKSPIIIVLICQDLFPLWWLLVGQLFSLWRLFFLF